MSLEEGRVWNIDARNYQAILEEGFRVQSERECVLFNLKGRYTVLRKDIGGCEGLFKSLLCLLSIPFCCCCCKIIKMCAEVIDGYETQCVFVPDREANKKMLEADGKALGVNFDWEEYSTKKIFVEKQAKLGKKIFTSPTCPNHSYMIIEGPVSHLSHVFLIFNGNYDRIETYLFSNEITGQEFDSAELHRRIDHLCQVWRPGYAVTHVSYEHKEVAVSSGAMDVSVRVERPVGDYRLLIEKSAS